MFVATLSSILDSQHENLASFSLQDGATKWYYNPWLSPPASPLSTYLDTLAISSMKCYSVYGRCPECVFVYRVSGTQTFFFYPKHFNPKIFGLKIIFWPKFFTTIFLGTKYSLTQKYLFEPKTFLYPKKCWEPLWYSTTWISSVALQAHLVHNYLLRYLLTHYILTNLSILCLLGRASK